MTKICEYEKCDNEIDEKRSDARFCCGPHRSAQDRLDKKKQQKLAVRTDTNAYSDEIMEELHSLRQENAILRQVVESQSEKIASLVRQNDKLFEILDKMARSMESAPRATAPQFAPVRVVNDEDIANLIEVTEATGNGDSAQNFINSLRALQGEPSGPKLMAGADVQLSEPNFDDMEIGL